MIVMLGIIVQGIVTDRSVEQGTIVQEIAEHNVSQDTLVQEAFGQIVVSPSIPYSILIIS